MDRYYYSIPTCTIMSIYVVTKHVKISPIRRCCVWCEAEKLTNVKISMCSDARYRGDTMHFLFTVVVFQVRTFRKPL